MLCAGQPRGGKSRLGCSLVREPFADHLRQPADFLQRQHAPWPDSGIVLCRGGPEERLAQIRFHIVAA